MKFRPRMVLLSPVPTNSGLHYTEKPSMGEEGSYNKPAFPRELQGAFLQPLIIR